MSVGESAYFELMGAQQYVDEDFFWRGPSFDGTSSTGRIQALTIPKTGLHQVRLLLDSTCVQEYNFLINIEGDDDSLYPNAFSPNTDATNDVFRIVDQPYIAEVQYLRIFDRWGNQVYTGTKNPIGWTPSDDAEGVYVYDSMVLFENGDLRKYKGSLHLMR